MKTKIIGLTGGIGSGKTTVAKKLQSLGIPVYFADDEAKKLMNQPEIALKIQELFGDEVYVDGVLQREVLAQKVFFDANNLTKLNAIVHPAVANDFKKWVNLHLNSKYVVKEAAILFETQGHKNCDFTILVTAPEHIRIQRVLKRDRVTKEQVEARIKNQWKDEVKKELADFVFLNDSFDSFDNSFAKLIIFLNNI
jgi:dephospho-CoA kinase